MCGAIVTSPFDVVKTRLQSSMFAEHPHVAAVGHGPLALRSSRSILWSFVETGHILRYCRRPCSLAQLTGEEQGYIQIRKPSCAVQRPRTYSCRSNPSTVDKLLHIRQREADHLTAVQWRKGINFRSFVCCSLGRDSNRHCN